MPVNRDTEKAAPGGIPRAAHLATAPNYSKKCHTTPYTTLRGKICTLGASPIVDTNEKKKPDHIYHMPIPGSCFKTKVVLLCKMSFPEA